MADKEQLERAINMEEQRAVEDASSEEEARVKSGVEAMKKGLQEIRELYGWTDEGYPLCKRLGWKLWYFVSGFVCLIALMLMLIFIGLFLIMLFLWPCWLLTCSRCRGQRLTFADYIRFFVGKQRLSLLTYPQSKQGLIWHFRNRIIGTIQTIDLTFNFAVNKPGNLYGYHKRHQEMFGDDFPFMFCLGVSKYDEVYDAIHCPDSERKGNFVGYIQTESNDGVRYLHGHALDTLDFRHSFSKKCNHILNETLPQFKDLDAVKLPEHFMERTGFWNDPQLVMENSSGIFYAVLFWVWFDAVLTDEEMKEIGATKAGALVMLTPPWLNRLFANLYFSRNVCYGAVKLFGRLYVKYGGDKVDKLYALCDQYGVERDNGLHCVAASIMFAGGEVPFQKAVARFMADKEGERAMFAVNPKKYICELVRHQDPVPSAVSMLKTEKRCTILGKEYVFPPGTPLSATIAFANQSSEHWKDPHQFKVNRDYGKMMAFNCMEGHFEKGQEDKLKTAPRYCPGRNTAFLFLKVLIEKLHTIPDRGNELDLEHLSTFQKMRYLMRPILSYQEYSDGSWSVEVLPEALRCLFYAEFVAFALIGIIVTFANQSWNGFDLFDNLIVDTFGNANLCIFFDDPPFSYFGAALWTPCTITAILYLYVDLCRVHNHMKASQPQFKEIGPHFYWWYRAVSIFIAVAMCYFVQVFATQPEQDLKLHWTPFGVWMWAMFVMGIQHYVYMLKIGLMSPEADKYWWGIAYLVFFGIWTLIKFSMDIINVYGDGDLGRWTGFVVLAYVTDFLFNFCLVGLPPMIYLLFIDHLDVVRFRGDGFKQQEADGVEIEEEEPEVILANEDGGAMVMEKETVPMTGDA